MQARQQADSSYGGFAKVAPFSHFFLKFFLYLFFFYLSFLWGSLFFLAWVGVIGCSPLDGDTTPGLTPVNTGIQ